MFRLFPNIDLEGLLCDENNNDLESNLCEDRGLKYECAQQQESPPLIMISCSIPLQVLALGFERLNDEDTHNQL
jgi:hypothetical protein